MFHVRVNGDYAEVFGSVNPWDEEARGAVNGIYEMEAFPLGAGGEIVDINNSTLDSSGVRITSASFKVNTALQARQARKKRDVLLLESDFVMLDDYPLTDKTAWKTYRQALRDVPQQASFPSNITWPTAPV